ncbi:MAG TPA: ATP-binding protein [Ramlibacter sp.]|uniref:HAMP domain-containing sensor histidine kinase n=1 Tax=Ramlibacter sp. TaxID=1917967 RepID=UPI002BEC60A0|nr:ATP-binding protein [Ramlibacter sp.]HVZ44450.1 ATP-binding protein [Ramlibacter sp.]
MAEAPLSSPTSPPQRPRWHRHAHRRFRHSLKARLVAVFLLLAFATTAIFIAGTQRALSVGWRDAAKPLLADYVDRLAQEIGSPPSQERARRLAERLPLRIRITGPELNWQSSADDDEESKYWSHRDDFHLAESGLLTRTTADGHRIEFGLDTRAWRNRPRVVGLFTLAGLLAITALAFAYVRRLLRPLDDIRAGAQRFGQGAFGEAIPIRHRDELGDLASDVNSMAASIHGMLEAKRALLLAISHELRSPITRARLNTELLHDEGETGPRRRALLRDLQEMADLVTDLLESERLGQGHAALHRESVVPRALVEETVAALRQQRDDAAGIRLDLADVPPVRLDPVRVRMLLRNLLDNALRHTPPNAPPPVVTLRSTDLGIDLRVRDSGPGVDEATLPHLGEAFWRPDASRERATGGVGLGLFLCKLVAQAHGGRLTLRNTSPGFEAIVFLPNGL